MGACTSEAADPLPTARFIPALDDPNFGQSKDDERGTTSAAAFKVICVGAGETGKTALLKSISSLYVPRSTEPVNVNERWRLHHDMRPELHADLIQNNLILTAKELARRVVAHTGKAGRIDPHLQHAIDKIESCYGHESLSPQYTEPVLVVLERELPPVTCLPRVLYPVIAGYATDCLASLIHILVCLSLLTHRQLTSLVWS